MSSVGAILAALFAATSAEAVPITGVITMSATASSVSVDFVNNKVTFTPASPAINARIDTVTGNMVGLAPVGTFVSYKDFFYDPLSVVGGNPIWTTTTGLSFSLTSISGFTESGTSGLLAFGSGTVSSTTAGFDTTAGDWSFNASKTGSVFSWGSTAAAVSRVPDGGASAILLGVSLLGLAGASRKFRKL